MKNSRLAMEIMHLISSSNSCNGEYCSAPSHEEPFLFKAAGINHISEPIISENFQKTVLFLSFALAQTVSFSCQEHCAQCGTRRKILAPFSFSHVQCSWCFHFLIFPFSFLLSFFLSFLLSLFLSFFYPCLEEEARVTLS